MTGQAGLLQVLQVTQDDVTASSDISGDCTRPWCPMLIVSKTMVLLVKSYQDHDISHVEFYLKC